MLKKQPIEFKSSVLTCLMLYINSNAVDMVQHAILKKIKEAPRFFNNASVILNVQNLTDSVEWEEMYKAIINTRIKIIGVDDNMKYIVKKKIIKSGIPILSKNKKIIEKRELYYKNICNQNHKLLQTKVITVPVRSGQKIYVHKSDLIIINNVNTGAELIADGNIYIFGIMRGRVLAGVNGDKTKNIFCTNFFAELVSIAGEYLLIDQIEPNFIGRGVRIFFKNDILSMMLLS
ncbi:Septum site-determining protein MinC [Buchnera aphidicola (Panaphis juglandis)]